MPRKPLEPKPHVMWNVYDEHGYTVTSMHHRVGAMLYAMKFAHVTTWRTLYRRGWRCVRVEVRPVNERSKR